MAREDSRGGGAEIKGGAACRGFEPRRRTPQKLPVLGARPGSAAVRAEFASLLAEVWRDQRRDGAGAFAAFSACRQFLEDAAACSTRRLDALLRDRWWYNSIQVQWKGS